MTWQRASVIALYAMLSSLGAVVLYVLFVHVLRIGAGVAAVMLVVYEVNWCYRMLIEHLRGGAR